MALGEFNLFTWKSKSAREKEQREYAVWAFPHGQKQRENLEVLLKELFPKGAASTSLISFLTCKELYDGALEDNGSRDNAVFELINTQKKYKQIIDKRNMTAYIALVLADADVDESCEYPSADAIRAHTTELEKLRKR